MDATNNVVVTVGHKAKPEHFALAREMAKRLGAPFAERGNTSLAALRERYGVPFVMVAKEKLVVDTPDGELYFHPGMAHLRLKNLRRGESDHLLDALGIQKGMRVLDCTLGMGADAIVESFGARAAGEVVALEKNPVVAALIAHGLQSSDGEHPTTLAAMRRVHVVCADYEEFLRAQPDHSFDAVYFDPMFRHPFMESAGIHPLRLLADPRPVSPEAIREACRVASRRVVLKESSKSEEFARLGFTEFEGGKYSNVRYGVMRIG
ncbi:MAG: class I SAM-dependent methyltransferase [Schwartzia sp.]|nr:class I SAM-dependent methyltransferase [Schwartzia sp. (in: firmicutes)]